MFQNDEYDDGHQRVNKKLHLQDLKPYILVSK